MKTRFSRNAQVPVIRGQKSQLSPLVEFLYAVCKLIGLTWEPETSRLVWVTSHYNSWHQSVHFYRSGLRTRESGKIAEDHNNDLVSLPTTFEVGRPEFAKQLVDRSSKIMAMNFYIFHILWRQNSVRFSSFYHDNFSLINWKSSHFSLTFWRFFSHISEAVIGW